ncbi:MAG TPA: PAS domain-containing protein [Spirochaetota bacterium]|mgnify:CR=1 FL=1|nr:PAS domain-containing protein [Spirochaetota bacterium]HPU88681.1 PAS domain-containing protein [Spirochaetota bacterium]
MKRNEYRTILDSLPVGILVLDEQVCVRDANDAAQRLFNASIDELRDRRCGDFVGCANRHDNERGCGYSSLCGSCALLNAVTEVFTGDKGVYDREVEFLIDRDGAPVRAWMRFSVVPVVYDGSRCVVVAFNDISERKRAKEALEKSVEKYRTLTENSPDLIARFDRQLRHRYVNAAAAAAGTLSPEEYIGKSIGETGVPEPARSTWEKRIQAVFDAGNMLDVVDSFPTPGGPRHFHTRLVPERDSAGSVQSVITIARDITERKLAEAQTIEAQAETQRLLREADRSRRALLSVIEDQKIVEKKLEETLSGLEQRVAERTAELVAANKELESYSYTVSHDLRAPLRHISGFIDMLHQHMGPRLDVKGAHYMEVIVDSARFMGQLIDELLSFSRMSRADMDVGRVDLNQLVGSIIKELTVENPGPVPTFELATLPAVPGDVALLRIAFVNLLSNAVKFSSTKNDSRITIGAVSQDDTTMVVIRDNGVGFDMRYADKLFGVFQRLHAADEFPGTGIGLATVKRIIERHGGSVRAEGMPGEGAAFYVSIPRCSHDAEEGK